MKDTGLIKELDVKCSVCGSPLGLYEDDYAVMDKYAGGPAELATHFKDLRIHCTGCSNGWAEHHIESEYPDIFAEEYQKWKHEKRNR